jgi:hypothetical protein
MCKLGNINAAALATIYKDGKAVARCIDTPNALGYAFNVTGGQIAKSMLKTSYAIDTVDRVAAKGWLKSNTEAGFITI